MEKKEKELNEEERSRLRHIHSRKSIAQLAKGWPGAQKWGKWLRREIVSQSCKLFQQVLLLSYIDKDFEAQLKRFKLTESIKLITRALSARNPGGSPRTCDRAVSGNNGERIFDCPHNDIDESEIDIVCTTGGMDIKLRERIWYEWYTRKEETLNAGGTLHDVIEIDSNCYDGDHRLVIFATQDNTTGHATMTSTDR